MGNLGNNSTLNQLTFIIGNMNQEKYNLNWHTYSDHLREMLHEMRKSYQLTDVTLVCDDKKQFKAHKIVLSACSSVFKDIIQDLPQSSSVIYLRGIQSQEMESILEFIYLGVATFYQERMTEFLNVAKNLEVKEISKDVELGDDVAKESDISDNRIDTEIENETEINIDTASTKKTYTRKSKSAISETCHLSTRESVKFSCNLCDYQAKHQSNLTHHIQSKHDGVKFPCNECEYQATKQGSLMQHFQSKHNGVKFPCNLCQYQATTQGNL